MLKLLGFRWCFWFGLTYLDLYAGRRGENIFGVIRSLVLYYESELLVLLIQFNLFPEFISLYKIIYRDSLPQKKRKKI